MPLVEVLLLKYIPSGFAAADMWLVDSNNMNSDNWTDIFSTMDAGSIRGAAR